LRYWQTGGLQKLLFLSVVLSALTHFAGVWIPAPNVVVPAKVTLVAVFRIHWFNAADLVYRRFYLFIYLFVCLLVRYSTVLSETGFIRRIGGSLLKGSLLKRLQALENA
jgi:hypothetical protein